MLDRPLLYLNTARRLRWPQIVFRLLRRIRPRRDRPSAPEPLALDVLTELGNRVARWGPGNLPRRMQRADDVLAGRFSFLGVVRQFSSMDWTVRHVSHLWSYNLHYFEYGIDLAWAARESGDQRFTRRFVHLVRDWDEQTTNASGDGWEPYAVSTRLINWVTAVALLGDRLPDADQRMVEESLHRQMLWLSRRLELHLQGNHLQRNLAAICVAGSVFSGPRARRLVDDALPKLWKELFDQTFEDGGHAERSPMYLSLALFDCLMTVTSLRVARREVPLGVSNRVRAMVSALTQLSRSDETLHRFHDAADGIAPEPGWLSAAVATEVGAAEKRREGDWRLPLSGYFGYRCGTDTFIVDAGPPGPPHLPAHAHCSLLSFELDLAGGPFIVDSGVNGYAEDPMREYFRSTRGHNTVSIGGGEQSEIWGVFRMARRAVPIAANLRATAEGFVFIGSYRPFHDRRAIHERRVERSSASWTVRDSVIGGKNRTAVSYLHVHPTWSISTQHDKITAIRDDTRVAIKVFGARVLRFISGETHPMQGWYAAQFGKAVPTTAIEIDVNNISDFGYVITTLGSHET